MEGVNGFGFGRLRLISLAVDISNFEMEKHHSC
jgi:hypothetical protein